LDEAGVGQVVDDLQEPVDCCVAVDALDVTSLASFHVVDVDIEEGGNSTFQTILIASCTHLPLDF
jgi:hypothetical protein